MTTRPAEFDARLMAYMPAIRGLAKRYAAKGDGEDLAQEVLEFALTKWQNYRPDGGFYKWLQLNAFEIAQAKRRKRREPVCHNPDADVSVAARQENIVFADQIVRRLKRSRAGRMHLRYAAGESQTSIGRRRKISAARVHQLVNESTAEIRRVAA